MKQNNHTNIELNRFIDKNSIELKLSCSSKEEAIRQLVENIFEHNKSLVQKHSLEDLYCAIEEREKMQSTGLGKGVAFPHARIPGLDEFYLAIGISKEGLDFNSIDKKPVNIICLMLSPLDRAYLILKIMAALARFLNDDDRRKKFVGCSNILEVLQVFQEGNIQVSSRIIARDIMRPIRAYVTLDESLQQTARRMHLNHLDVLPVVDKEMRFCGVISCLDIFKFGIPDFFSQLKTVSFVKHLDPFEKYFQHESAMKVADIYRKETEGVLLVEATLMEIIFEMTVKNSSTLFIVENGVLKGVIDRFNIIDKILIS